MKRYLIISLLALAACNNGPVTSKVDDKNHLSASIVSNPLTANGMDTVAAARKPVMDFKTDTLHNFGAIHEGEKVSYDFAFTNTGKTPLIISGANGSCGCTVPEYPHDAVAPGASGIMKVTFNSAGKSGHQSKSVTIHTNTNKNIEMLYINAEVQKQ